MADDTTKTAPAQPAAADIKAMIEAAVSAALTKSGAIPAPRVPPALDAVDTLVLGAIGKAKPAGATVSTVDRLTALEAQVAALAIATGQSTSAAFRSARKAASAVQLKAASPASAQADG